MKYLILILVFASMCKTESSRYNDSPPNKIFQLVNDGEEIANFDSDKNYLKINIESFKKEQPKKTNFIQRLFGKRANLILGTVDLKTKSKLISIPIFKFSRSEDNVYSYESIGINAKNFNQVITRRMILKDDDNPVLSFTIKKWVDRDKITLVESLIDGASNLNIAGSAMIEQAKVANKLVSQIINEITPDDDIKQVINIPLNSSNINNSSFSIYYKDDLIKHDDGFVKEPLIKFSVEVLDPLLKTYTLEDYLQKFPDKGIKIFYDAIEKADGDLKNQGKESIISLFRGMENYVSGLDINLIDKKLLMANAFVYWPDNAIKGIKKDGKSIKLNINDYQRLRNSKPEDIRPYISNKFFEEDICIKTFGDCKTQECYSLAKFLDFGFTNTGDDLYEITKCLLADNINLTVENGFVGIISALDFCKKFRCTK